MSNAHGIILDLRRVVYRCELLQHPELSDGARQSLWESVVATLADIRQLEGCDQTTHGQIVRERTRHAATSGGAVVIPDGVSLADVETGCLAAPCVDPTAARTLAERLIERLQAEIDQT
ncbi:MAG: hypothetical protein QOJ72_2738 [Nocardioidaceae bacterium]|nr:hypothetical protein [Nocardioidaceae bacterium]